MMWLKHDAHFGEHPKTLRLRRLAGSKADAAEVGWWRLVEAAKRYGSWTFADDDHLAHVLGRYARYLPLYRQVGFLDDLTIHDAEEYQSTASGAERVAKHRATRNATNVTDVTPREEQSREEEKEQTVARDPADIYWSLTGRYPTDKVLKWVDDLAAKYGAEATCRAIVAVHVEDPSTGTLLGRSHDRLRAEARSLDRAELEAEQARLREKRAQPRVEEAWRAEYREAIRKQYGEDAA